MLAFFVTLLSLSYYFFYFFLSEEFDQLSKNFQNMPLVWGVILV
jgi:hypothetical protein